MELNFLPLRKDITAPLIDKSSDLELEGGSGADDGFLNPALDAALRDRHQQSQSTKTQKTDKNEHLLRADRYDLVLTGSFVVGFIGNMAIQVFYILLWAGKIGNTTEWRCVVNSTSGAKHTPLFYKD